jgi:hypothetical protein
MIAYHTQTILKLRNFLRVSANLTVSSVFSTRNQSRRFKIMTEAKSSQLCIFLIKCCTSVRYLLMCLVTSKYENCPQITS